MGIAKLAYFHDSEFGPYSKEDISSFPKVFLICYNTLLHLSVHIFNVKLPFLYVAVFFPFQMNHFGQLLKQPFKQPLLKLLLKLKNKL